MGMESGGKSFSFCPSNHPCHGPFSFTGRLRETFPLWVYVRVFDHP
jgi:hypothetical protein